MANWRVWDKKPCPLNKIGLVKKYLSRQLVLRYRIHNDCVLPRTRVSLHATVSTTPLPYSRLISNCLLSSIGIVSIFSTPSSCLFQHTTYVISLQEISHKNKHFNMSLRYNYDVRLLRITCNPITHYM